MSVCHEADLRVVVVDLRHEGHRDLLPTDLDQIGVLEVWMGMQARCRQRIRREYPLYLGELNHGIRPVGLKRRLVVIEVVELQCLPMGFRYRLAHLSEFLFQRLAASASGGHQRHALYYLLNSAQDRLGRSDHLLEPISVFSDPHIDLFFYGVGVEVVCDVDLWSPPNAVDAANPLFDSHEVPGHVVVDEPITGLEVESFRHGIGTKQNPHLIACTEQILDLLLGELLPGSGLWVPAASAVTGVTGNLVLVFVFELLADPVEGVGELGEDHDGSVTAEEGALDVVDMTLHLGVRRDRPVQVSDETLQLVYFLFQHDHGVLEGIGVQVGKIFEGSAVVLVQELRQGGLGAETLQTTPQALPHRIQRRSEPSPVDSHYEPERLGLLVGVVRLVIARDIGLDPVVELGLVSFQRDEDILDVTTRNRRLGWKNPTPLVLPQGLPSGTKDAVL